MQLILFVMSSRSIMKNLQRNLNTNEGMTNKNQGIIIIKQEHFFNKREINGTEIHANHMNI